MLSKLLRRKEVEMGFVQIPTKHRAELLGDIPHSFETTLNGEPARVDEYGRIKSKFLKNKYPINAKINISKNETGFQVTLIECKDDNFGTIEKQAPKKIEDTSIGELVSLEYNKLYLGDCAEILRGNPFKFY